MPNSTPLCKKSLNLSPRESLSLMSTSTKRNAKLIFFCCLVQQATKEENSVFDSSQQKVHHYFPVQLSSPQPRISFLPMQLRSAARLFLMFGFCNQRNLYVVKCVYPVLICTEKAKAYPTTSSAALISYDQVRFSYHLQPSPCVKNISVQTIMVYSPEKRCKHPQQLLLCADQGWSCAGCSHPHLVC